MQGTVAFTNESISNTELPQLADLKFELLSPAYAQANRYIDLFSTLLVISLLYIIQLQNISPLSEEVISVFRYIIWAVALIGAFVIARSITTPVTRLLNATRYVANGNYSKELEIKQSG